MKKYKINGIFESIQGEGFWTGTPVLFVRFAGCNLECPWCDTKHNTVLAKLEGQELLKQIINSKMEHVVLTGGEPMLQVDTPLLHAIFSYKKFVQIETNGTKEIPQLYRGMISWITLSPKSTNAKVKHADELKVVYRADVDLDKYYNTFMCNHYFLQPLWTDDREQREANIHKTVRQVMTSYCWRLSLQTHKLIGLP